LLWNTIIHGSVINLKAVPETGAYFAVPETDGGVFPCGLAYVAFPSACTNLTCALAFSFFLCACCTVGKMLFGHMSHHRMYL
jgi:hypothetical protein